MTHTAHWKLVPYRSRQKDRHNSGDTVFAPSLLSDAAIISRLALRPCAASEGMEQQTSTHKSA